MPGQNIPGHNISGHNISDKIYRTKNAGQNIPYQLQTIYTSLFQNLISIGVRRVDEGRKEKFQVFLRQTLIGNQDQIVTYIVFIRPLKFIFSVSFSTVVC